MTHLRELIHSNPLRNMESDATPVDVSRVESILVGLLVDSLTQTIRNVLAFPNCTSLPTHIARHGRLPTSSLTPVQGLTRTTLFLPNPPTHGSCAFPDPTLRWCWKSQRSCVLPLEARQHLRFGHRGLTRRHARRRVAACD
eukprot:4251118-Pleurochrysis_carterae.AAC.1